MAVLGRCIRIDDPRNRLERMKKRELVEYAHLNGQMDINANMQADDYKDINGRVTPGIRSLLSQRGLNGLAIDGRRLGQMGRQETVSILPRNPKPAPPQATPEAHHGSRFSSLATAGSSGGRSSGRSSRSTSGRPA